MRVITISLLSALASCALTFGILHHLRAREEGKYWWLRSQNDQMRYEAYQRVQTARKASAPVPVRTETAAPAEGVSSDATTGAQYGYHNAGLASPADALQTFVWACERVDTALVARMLTMEPAEHSKAEAFLAAQPPEFRARWTNVETLAANLMILSALGDSFPSSEVLAASPVDMQGADRASCGAVRKLSFRKVGSEWHCELSAQQLEKLHQEVTQVLGNARTP